MNRLNVDTDSNVFEQQTFSTTPLWVKTDAKWIINYDNTKARIKTPQTDQKSIFMIILYQTSSQNYLISLHRVQIRSQFYGLFMKSRICIVSSKLVTILSISQDFCRSTYSFYQKIHSLWHANSFLNSFLQENWLDIWNHINI